ncbi:MAG: SUMF1/EgtB/PvdO family nonheme iron enzyme [Rikenellaceae bacterium]
MGGNGVPCVHGRDQVGNLCVYDRETHNMRRLGFDQDCSWGPTMMNNGKVMYTRWEYTDLNHVYSRIVMSMNPDGTEQKALFGSGMMFPNATYDIQAIPNHPSEFVGIITGHHKNTRSGRLFLFDPAISRTSTDAMIHEFPYRERELVPFIKDQLVDNVWPQFLKPQAVDNKTFITIAKLRPEGLWGLYLVDIYDNLVLLAEYEGEGVTNPALVRKQYRPNIIPDKTDLSKKTATVFIQDIYQGVGLEGVPKGTIKQLRIHTYEFAYRASPSHVESQGIHSGWDMKTCLGIVDLNEDGSALFTIPANTPISIQPLDEKGRAVQWMRSWLTGMPGEVVSCVGCHEDLNQIPVPKSSMASKMEPLALTPPKGGVAPMSFDNHVQPMLDRKCIGCHNSKHKIDFTGGRKDKQGFSESYLNLHPHVYRQGNEAGMRVLTPYEYYANNSSLIQMLESGHYGVELDKDDWYALTNWIDYNVPDKGYFQIVDSQLFPNQYEHRIYLAKKYGNGIYSPWKEQTEDFKTYLASLPKSEPEIPSYTAPKFKQLSVKGFPFTAKKGEEKIITVNGVDFKFIKIPAGKFIMGENRANSNASPTRKAEVKREFWMSESELTNAQVRAIIPEHDSRYFDRQGMTRPDEGYPANEDNQVAVRISYIKAQELVSKMSEITKQNINLPSEVQWEWAARAGSDKDYWFSTTDSYGDFSPYENLADKQMTKLALKNIVTQWKPGTIEYKHNAYHPKDESVDDNTMLTSNPKDYTYKANGFGLYNMLGNVSEWTRSDNEGNVNEKIVKGGAWNTHPKDARVAPRRYYYPYQAPHNVGVRLIIEP